MFELVKWRLLAYAVGAAAALSTVTYFVGQYKGVQQCNAAHKAKADEAALEQVSTDLEEVQTQAKKSNDAGVTLAKAEQTIQTRTQYLTKEVIKYVPAKNNHQAVAAAECGVDLVGLRRTWNAANLGADPAPAAAP